MSSTLTVSNFCSDVNICFREKEWRPAQSGFLWKIVMKKRNLLIATIASLLIVGIALCFTDSVKATIATVKLGDPYEHSHFSGTLNIPSVGIELPCIQMDASETELSKLAVDSYECGAKEWYTLPSVNGKRSGTWIIADHNWQGFEAIMNCSIGDSATFVDADGVSTEYVVVDLFEGYIDNGHLYDRDGKQFLRSEPDNMVFITCYKEADVSADPENRRFFVYLEAVE